MTADADTEPVRKKRKSALGNAIRLGRHRISLDRYLSDAPPTPALPPPSQSQSQQAVEIGIGEATDDRPGSTTSNKGGKGRHKESRNEGELPSRSGFGLRLRDDPALLAGRRALPIWKHREQIRVGLRPPNGQVLIVVGETGSGKSTQVPQILIREDWCRQQKLSACAAGGKKAEEKGKKGANGMQWVGGMVAITQPRRVAATTLAYRVAEEAGTPLTGGSSSTGVVGYSVRFDRRVPRGARIVFLTEGMMLQELLQDPGLTRYSAVIVDEVHERSIDVDLLLGFLYQIIHFPPPCRRGVPLKVIIMSATADVDALCAYFSRPPAHASADPSIAAVSTSATAGAATEPTGAVAQGASVSVIHIEGRQHPVEVTHTLKPVPDLQEALLKTIFSIHVHEPMPGDILAFLTGQEEIEAMQALVAEYAATLGPEVPHLRALPLYGQLPIEAQHQAFRAAAAATAGQPHHRTRKVVLATNIAETSVTVPGVRFVVDGGKAKVRQFRARLGMESLLAKPISQSSALQRAGRAGREAPGKCFRLYTAASYASLEARDRPEILRNDVLGAALAIKARGVHDLLSFPFLDPPDPDALRRALVHLRFLGAVDDDGRITPRGRQMAAFPVPVPYARALVAAADSAIDDRPAPTSSAAAASSVSVPSRLSTLLLDVIDVIACLTAGEDMFLPLQGGRSDHAGHDHSHDNNNNDKDDDARTEAEDLRRRELYRREGDLLTYLVAMRRFAAEDGDRTEWCRRRRISLRHMRQAVNIRRQLHSLCQHAGLLSAASVELDVPTVAVGPDRAEALIKCFLAGFAFRTAVLGPDGTYATVRGRHAVAVHPSSVLHGQRREAILFLEYVFTQRSYARKVSAIQAAWIADSLEREL